MTPSTTTIENTPFFAGSAPEVSDAYFLSEMRRITSIEMVPAPPEDLIEIASKHFLQKSAFDSGKRLLKAQAEALAHFDICGNIFAAIGVGGGKTLTSLTIANYAYEKGTMRRAMLMIPPELVPQLRLRALPWARTMIRFPLSVYWADTHRTEIKRRAGCPLDGLYILPYSRLSARDGEELLQAIAPDIIIADEAHNLARESSARSKRFFHFLKARPTTDFVPMSGTMSKKQLGDYGHLINAALKEKSPVPHHYQALKFWGWALSAESAGFHKSLSRMLPLVKWANIPRKWTQEDQLEDIREAFAKRFTSTPGVITSKEAGCDSSIQFKEFKLPPSSSEVESALSRLEESWVAPSGEELEHAIVKFKYQQELAFGYYNRLEWPEDHPLVDNSKELYITAQTYHRALRMWWSNRAHTPGMDTPMTIGLEMERNGAQKVGAELYALWVAYRDLRRRATAEKWPERIRIPETICPQAMDAIALHASKHKGGALVWCDRNYLAEEIVSRLREAGRKTIHAKAGMNALVGDPAHRNDIMVASIKAHGTGKDLQHFHHNIIVEMPGGAVSEQLLGRTHRHGQEADTVTYEIIRGAGVGMQSDVLDAKLATAINDSYFTHATGTGRQKLIYGDWDFAPPVLDSSILRAMGTEAYQLTSAQQQDLKNFFN